MSRPSTVAGIAGVTFAAMAIVAFVLDFVIIATTGGPPQIYAASLSADLARARTSVIWPTETWLYALQIVPFMLFVPGLRTVIRGAANDALADVSIVALVGFMALHTLHNLLILTVVQVIAPSYVPGAPDAAATEALARSFLGLAYAAFLPGGGVGGMFLIAGLLAFAGAQRRTHAFPAWSGRLATAGALFMAIAYLQYLIAPAFFLALVGYAAYLAWAVLVSVGLLRSEPQDAVALAALPA